MKILFSPEFSGHVFIGLSDQLHGSTGYGREQTRPEVKYLTPSSQWVKGHVEKDYKICDSLKRGTLVGRTMADVGNCIHQIYCGIEENIYNEAYYKDLIASYGLSTYLIDYKGIRKAWEELVAWLAEKYGKATHIYHEHPFSHLKDGQVFTGSIDLVWQTEEGDILIDFKKTLTSYRGVPGDPEVKVRYNQETGEEKESYTLMTEKVSTQGINIKHMMGGNIIVELPWLASQMDVKLCYAYLNAIKKAHRGARIMDESGGHQHQGRDAAYNRRRGTEQHPRG